LVKLDQRKSIGALDTAPTSEAAVKKIYNLYDAETALSRLVDRAAAGEEIIIAKAGAPRAKLVPVRTSRRPRNPGGWEGRVRIARNFDAPLPKAVRDAFAGRPGRS
jgi:prevent-host-death family protein